MIIFTKNSTNLTDNSFTFILNNCFDGSVEKIGNNQITPALENNPILELGQMGSK